MSDVSDSLGKSPYDLAATDRLQLAVADTAILLLLGTPKASASAVSNTAELQ
jgi:hypothetical protein